MIGAAIDCLVYFLNAIRRERGSLESGRERKGKFDPENFRV
jgi:hypothetical protein